MEEVELKGMSEEVMNYLKGCKVIAETDGQSMKAYVAEVTRGDRVLDVDDEGFKLLTGVDVATLRRVYSADNYSKMVTYNKAENGIRVDCILFDNDMICNNALTHYFYPEDFLKTFPLAEEKIGKAQWLPDNWKELMSDEQKEEIARDWCKENSSELEDYLDDDDKEAIADAYIEQNNSDVLDKAYDYLDSYDQREVKMDSGNKVTLYGHFCTVEAHTDGSVDVKTEFEWKKIGDYYQATFLSVDDTWINVQVSRECFENTYKSVKHFYQRIEGRLCTEVGLGSGIVSNYILIE